jgi:hypothetical protein
MNVPFSAIKFHAASVLINTPCSDLRVICHRTVSGKRGWNGHLGLFGIYISSACHGFDYVTRYVGDVLEQTCFSL